MKILLFLVPGFFISINNASAQSLNNGPHHCLLHTTSNCPIRFLQHVHCMHDASTCNDHTLDDLAFFSIYLDIIYSVIVQTGNQHVLIDCPENLTQQPPALISPPNPISCANVTNTGLYIPFHIALLDWYPADVMHDALETAICLNSTESCYLTDGSWTIYHDASCKLGQDDNCNDDPPYGGPRDSKICQVTPEACVNFVE